MRPGEQGEITFEAHGFSINGNDAEPHPVGGDRRQHGHDRLSGPRAADPAGSYHGAQFGPIFQRCEWAGPTYGGLVKLMAQTATEIGVLGSGQGNGSSSSGSDVFARVIRDAESQLNGAITGQLFLNDASNPLPNVALSIATADDSQADEAVTFDDGSFSFPAMPAGTYNLFVTGYLLTAPLQIVVPAGGSLSGIDITVAVRASLAGAFAIRLRKPPWLRWLWAVSDQGLSYNVRRRDGSYQFTGLPAGHIP